MPPNCQGVSRGMRQAATPTQFSRVGGSASLGRRAKCRKPSTFATVVLAVAIWVLHGEGAAGSLGLVAGSHSFPPWGTALPSLRGGRGRVDAMDLPEGPEADSEPIAELSRTIDVDSDDDDSSDGMVKRVVKEGRHVEQDDNEYDTGNGAFPLEGDLVSVRITIYSAGNVRATTEELLRLADADAAGSPYNDSVASTGDAMHRQFVTPVEAGHMPLQMQYGYGGMVRVTHPYEARSVPGTFSFRLGTRSDYIVAGLEEAIMEMRPGERARITLSGHKGFDGAGFKGLGRTWGIPSGTAAEADVEVVSWNTIDVTGDGGAVVYLPHTSASKILQLRDQSEWRVLERRPSARASVLLRCTLRAVHHSIPGIGNTTTVLPRSEGIEGAAEEAPCEFARWVDLGKGQLPWGMELAVIGHAIAGVPFAVRLAGAHYLDSCSGDGKEGREDCGADAMTYEVQVDDWHEARNLTADGGIILYQRNVGSPKYNAFAYPIADGDQVLLDIEGCVLGHVDQVGPLQAEGRAGSAHGCGRAGGSIGDEERDGANDWRHWQPSVWAADGMQAKDRIGGGTSSPQGKSNTTENEEDGRVLLPDSSPGDGMQPHHHASSLAASPGDLSWMQGPAWPRARRLVTVGNFETASGLEKALMGLRVGQSAQLRLRPPYLNMFDGDSAAGATFGPPCAAGLELSFTVLSLLPATRRPLAMRLAMAARRRALGNQLFGQGRYCDALALYRMGADLVFHWKAGSRDIALVGGDEHELMSSYDKERIRQASAHMEPAARRKYVSAMMDKEKERRRRKERAVVVETVTESASGDGVWEGLGQEGNEISTIRAAQKLRRVCVLNAAQCLLRLKRPAEAKADCDKILEDDEGNARAFHRRCLAHLQLGDVAAARADLQSVVRIISGDGEGRDEEDGGFGAKVPVSEIERLKGAIHRAEAAERKTDKHVYGKMFAKKTPRAAAGSSRADEPSSQRPVTASRPSSSYAKGGTSALPAAGGGAEADVCEGPGEVLEKVVHDFRGKRVVERMMTAGDAAHPAGPVVLIETAPDSPDEQARKRKDVFSAAVQSSLEQLQRGRRDDEVTLRSCSAGDPGQLRYTPTHVAGASGAGDDGDMQVPEEEQAQIRNLLRRAAEPHALASKLGRASGLEDGSMAAGVRSAACMPDKGGAAGVAEGRDGGLEELLSKADVSALFDHARNARFAVFRTLRQASECAQGEASLILPKHARFALEELRRGLVGSEGEYEQMVANIDTAVTSVPASPRKHKLQALRTAFAHSLGVTARLISRLAAALDPHVDWEQLDSEIQSAESEEIEKEQAALEAWTRAKRYLLDQGEHGAATSSAALPPCSDSARPAEHSCVGVGSGERAAEARPEGEEWQERMTDACTRYKAGSGGEQAMDAMDEICDLLKEAGVPDRARAKTRHDRCPGHVENPRDSSQACPNCHLIGAEIETNTVADDAMAPAPAGAPLLDENTARQFVFPVETSADKCFP